MKYYARVNSDNIVTSVVVVSDECNLNECGEETEHLGCQFLWNLIPESINDRWIQTYKDDEINPRKNYAGIGDEWNETLNAFIPPKPAFDSWILDEEICLWKPPFPPPSNKPENVLHYSWDESIVNWIPVYSE